MSLSFKDKTFFITGASCGIGFAIAPRDARDSASIAIAAKTETPHPKLEGTVHSAAEAIEKAGGEALPLIVDVRDEAAGGEALPLIVDVRDEAAVKGAIHQTAALRIARHRRQQRERDFAQPDRANRYETLRSDAWRGRKTRTS
jgi:NAD(P)-dependent dehydrogenase (short-subunit alcohol dehydrogenase family)